MALSRLCHPGVVEGGGCGRVGEGEMEGRKEGSRTRGGEARGGAAPTNKNARFLSAAQTELECGGGKNGAGEGVDEMGWCARSDL